MVREQFSGGQFSSGAIIIGRNFPRGHFSLRAIVRGQLSWGKSSRGQLCGGNYHGGNYARGQLS